MLSSVADLNTDLMSTIEIDHLTKHYHGMTAVDDLSLSVDAGEVFGFLGPNGAGKSTTINAMLDFTRPTSGSVRVFGHDVPDEPVAVRRRSGLLLEGYGAYPQLTGREHVKHAIETKNVDDDPDELLDRVGLNAARDRRAGGYSKGMRQRMAIAVALVGNPDLLVLDEPSTGLDPNGACRLREIVTQEADRGATVFFSTQLCTLERCYESPYGSQLEPKLGDCTSAVSATIRLNHRKPIRSNTTRDTVALDRDVSRTLRTSISLQNMLVLQRAKLSRNHS